MPERTVLVTGAAGFIGSHAAEALRGAGYGVVGVDNFCDFYDRRWKEANLKTAKIDVEEMDITDGPRIAALIARVKPHAILHLAAMAGVRPSIERPVYYAKVNVEGTTHLLQAAVENQVAKFVFAYSSSVYGNNPKVPFSESDEVTEPISPYAATKRAGELLCHTFWHLYKMPVACLRFFTVYGPRQRPDLAIHKFARLIHFGKPIPVYGDGSTARDYTYISDIVDGVVAVTKKEFGYQIFNLGESQTVRLSYLIEVLEKAMGRKAVIDRQPQQPGDVPITYANIGKARSLLGYTPGIKIEAGIPLFIEWFHRQVK